MSESTTEAERNPRNSRHINCMPCDDPAIGPDHVEDGPTWDLDVVLALLGKPESWVK